MKEKHRAPYYTRYCDDTVMLARSKAEAWALARAYEQEAREEVYVVKASLTIARIKDEEKAPKRKRRKRQRGGNRFSGLLHQSKKLPGKERDKAASLQAHRRAEKPKATKGGDGLILRMDKTQPRKKSLENANQENKL